LLVLLLVLLLSLLPARGLVAVVSVVVVIVVAGVKLCETLHQHLTILEDAIVFMNMNQYKK
jgi:hypothetical protein